MPPLSLGAPQPRAVWGSEIYIPKVPLEICAVGDPVQGADEYADEDLFDGGDRDYVCAPACGINFT